jgi:cobalt-zinc-cadmium efflux system outer membrane protein
VTELLAAATQTERLEEVAQGRFDAGRGPRVDVVRAHAERARARAEAVAAVRLVHAAAIRLSLLLDGGEESELQAAGEVTYAAATPALVELLGGQDHHPTLRRDSAQIFAAHQRTAREQRLRWPSLNAQLTANLFDPTLTGPDVIGGLSFELPVLSLRGGAIAAAQAQRTLAELTAQLDARRLRVELREAVERSEAARGKLVALREEILPSVEEAKRMTDEAYESGRIELIRLLDAQRVLIDSKLAQIDALATWARAMADVERAAGVNLGGVRP